MPGIRRRAFIDLDAFRSQCGDVVDARANAYGHGLELILPAALDAGAGRVVVSNDRDAELAMAAGFAPGAVARDPEAPDAATSGYGLHDGGRPVMSVVGEVVALKTVPAGSGVSYGYTFRTPAPTRLALVALGYADGIPRLASNRAHVLVAGARHPLVGRIAMDQFVLDVGEAPVEPGMDAVLFGADDAPSARDWAAWTERDPLALTAGIAERVERSPR